MSSSCAKVLPTKRLSLKDRLSRLTFTDACKLLGPEGRKLLQKNANAWEAKIEDDVYLGADLFRLRFPDESSNDKPTVVSITLMAEARNRLHCHCTQCQTICAHLGYALSLILEEKIALGLAAPPVPREPVESLSETDLVRRALVERAERAKSEKMSIKSVDPKRPWTDYVVTNRLSGKTYRVALRGPNAGDSFCSCPDFRTNTLGTCKHVLKVLSNLKRRFTPRQLRQCHKPTRLALHLHYAEEVTLRLAIPENLDEKVAAIVAPLRDKPIDDLPDLLKRLNQLQKLEHEITIFPDAEELIQQRMSQDRLRAVAAEIRRDPARHPLRNSLLKMPLLPYQLDGIAFAAGACRAVLADDMGLGKTMQGVGTAELLARETDIRKVLVICPASLKSQWRSEIHRFCDRDVQLVNGPAAERHQQYANDCFFTICNYEQVLRDILAIEQTHWDMIILDEGQRIKNWESKTSRVVKALRSRFALVLSGTPLENRLDDLYSIIQFVDDRRLGPGFRFFNKHRVVDDRGKVLGYRNLADLRETLQPILLRRTRDSVQLELPERTMELVRIPASDEQLELHRSHMQIVSAIARKKFISEMDLLRLQKELLMCRMSADSTYLVDKREPAYSTKLERLDELFESLFEEEGRKVVLFSEWTTMLNLIEPLLEDRKLPFVRLDGSVPQRQREELVHRFQTDPECRLFLTTNAGSTGLNLQSANTVINVDLPWNPAVLEQRIARAHRMGQRQTVQVFVLVTEGTIEESLLATLASKKDLALAALDIESEVDAVDIVSGIQELKGRLEVLLGARPEAPLDQTVQQNEEQTAERLAASNGDGSAPSNGDVSSASHRDVSSASHRDELPGSHRDVSSGSHRDRVAAAGGELLGAAFKLLGELVSQNSSPPPPESLVASVRNGLGACIEEDTAGKPRLVLSLPDRGSLNQLAETLAKLLVAGQGAGAEQGA